MADSIRPNSKDAIVEAAFAVFSRDPSAALSEVADLAGVGRATLHRYFSSRDELVRALAHLAIQEMDDAVDKACAGIGSYGEAMRVSLDVLIPLGDRHGFLALEPLEDDAELKDAFDRQRRETEEMIEAAKSE
ncbi:MAG: helix-turn-helix domain-containing protein, partial [Pseudomonadota bacterium]